MKSANTFNPIYENLLGRYQQGGFISGDRIKFKKNALSLDFFKDKPSNFLELIKSCMQTGFDKNLRISALKSIHPTTTQNYRGGTESPDDVYCDVVIEINPGLYHSPMTVPIGALELIDDGINTGPVPDSMKRPSEDGEVSKGVAKQIVNQKEKNDDGINLTQTNTKIPGGKDWDDSKVGGGNFSTSRYLGKKK